MKKTTRLFSLIAGSLTLGLAAASTAHAQTFLVDFGSTLSSPNWNNVPGASGTPVAYNNLVTSTGVVTTVNMTISGTTNESATGSFATTGFGDFTTSSVTDYLASSNTTSTISLSGLDPTKTYTFEFFASRNGGGDRTTVYTLSNGGFTSTAFTSLDAALNASTTSVVSSYTPSLTGNITIDLTRGAANSVGFTYINAMIVTTDASAIPEPSSFAALAGLGALSCVGLRRRRR